MKTEEKKFQFFQLVDETNICNQLAEKKAILSNIKEGKKTVLYGPRNFGKTSLVKNSVIPSFRKSNRQSFVFFADLLEIRDMDQLITRMQIAFEQSFSGSFPVKNFLENVKLFISRARPDITIDPITAMPSLSLKLTPDTKQYCLEFIFTLIRDIAGKVRTLIVIDEFQDTALVEGARAAFRNALESCSDIPVVLMGSKKHLLSRIFSRPDSPLAFWGEDIEFKPISYDDYHAYILERFTQKNINMEKEDSVYLQDLLWRIPEPINIVASHIYDNYTDITVTRELINRSVKEVLVKRESRYEQLLSSFLSSEERVCTAVAKLGSVATPQGKQFTRMSGLTPRSTGKIISRMMDKGVIELLDGSYRLSDPLFNFYLKTFR